jgi:hypothetical protein
MDMSPSGYCLFLFRCFAIATRDPHGKTLVFRSFHISFLIWMHYSNKYIELFDTVFMVP